MNEHAVDGVAAMIAGSGPVVIGVLLVLVLFSIMSWAIIAWKFGMISKSRKESEAFLDSFFELPNAERLYTSSETFRSGSLPRVYRAGYVECSAMRERASAGQLKERIRLAVKRELNTESKRLTRMVPFLATVGNTAPFIGLFGTVWGIMSSFQNIGLMKSASLAAVAPGISEALVATAAGLVAAIPAVIGYNYFSSEIALIERDMEEFAPDFVESCLNQ